MQAFEIKNEGKLIHALLEQDFFLDMLLIQYKFKSSFDLEIDGEKNFEFFDTDDEEKKVDERFIRFRQVAPVFMDAMAGKTKPLSFDLHLTFNKDNIGRFIESRELDMDPASVTSLNINISYTRERLLVTTGVSRNVFTLDKDLDKACDAYIQKVLTKLELIEE